MPNKQTIDRQAQLARDYLLIRRQTEHLCAHLVEEDTVVQTMADVSPTKWHIAHTSWFFETFILKSYAPDYREFHPRYNYIFNSYYNAVGDRHCRAKRGQLSRPTLKEVKEYRRHIDLHMQELFERMDQQDDKLLSLIELGLHHEQQHQELMVTDIKHVFACSPLHPVYWNCQVLYVEDVPQLKWMTHEKNLYQIGHAGNGFGFDNEFPSHEAMVHGFKIANRLTTNAEYLAFIEDGGYERAELWLSDGWATVNQQEWRAPLYWDKENGDWYHFTLNGYVKVNPSAPVCHVSFFEADAFARWAGKRLPREEEWEVAFRNCPIEGNLIENERFSPIPIDVQSDQPYQVYGDVWEWTASPYVGYPGFKPASGAVGEYNGKFMSNQMVLRGGSCATSQKHIRPTYRNFFYPDQRWQFMGIRLADD